LHAISVRDDTGSKLTGIGVIDKIVTPGSEPIFRADGYLIRITSTTQLTFTSDLNSLSNISTNSWIHFEGKLDKSGILIATKASFLPAKPTHFAAIPGLRSEICSTDGLVLIPKQVVERLKNDAQLAAVFADGIALNMQRQIARYISLNRMVLGIALSGDAAGFWVPDLGLATGVALAYPEHEVALRMQEERSRIALAILNDAGYDLQQAPEAWRLLAPNTCSPTPAPSSIRTAAATC
jgi:hypothetical protein